MNKPKFSILCPAYNHEKYIKYFIESVLKQTEQNFELIIIDDCSTDNTIIEIEKFNDKRIKFYKNTFNKGINATLNELIQYADSEIVGLVASDDLLSPSYIEEILNLFHSDTELSAVYVSLQFIDNEGKIIKEREVLLNETVSQQEILKKHFFEQNSLPSPGMALKKQTIEKYLPLPSGLRQYVDWHLHNQLLINEKIKLTNKKLIKYRITPNSACSRSLRTIKREMIECDILMEPFLEIKDLSTFKDIFRGKYEAFGEPIQEEVIPYFLARMALKSNYTDRQRWGYLTLIKFISKDKNLNLLNSLYNVDFKYLANLIDSYKFESPITIDINYYEKKIKKYRKRFIIILILIILTTLSYILVEVL